MTTSLVILTLTAQLRALPGCPPPPEAPMVVVPAPPPVPPHPAVPPPLADPRCCVGPWRCRLVLRRYRVRVRRRVVYRSVYHRERPYHDKILPTVGTELGYLGFIRPPGAYRFVRPLALISAYFGWNFGSFVGLELSLGGVPAGERDHGLGGTDRLGLAVLGLDLKVRLVRPAPSSRVVPFLQAGLGGYLLSGRRPEPGACGHRACLLARGVGAQVGGGLDIYAMDSLIVGLRVLYRPLFMDRFHCPPGTPCARAATGESQRVHAFSAGLTLTAFWSHL